MARIQRKEITKDGVRNHVPGDNKEIGRNCESSRSYNCKGSQSPLVKLHERKQSLRAIG